MPAKQAVLTRPELEILIRAEVAECQQLLAEAAALRGRIERHAAALRFGAHTALKALAAAQQ